MLTSNNLNVHLLSGFMVTKEDLFRLDAAIQSQNTSLLRHMLSSHYYNQRHSETTELDHSLGRREGLLEKIKLRLPGAREW